MPLSADGVSWRALALAALVLALTACKPAADAALLGTLEWDRIAVPAEASEPSWTPPLNHAW